MIAMGLMVTLTGCRSYTNDTTFIPPGTKKSFWKTAYQSLTERLGFRPVPQIEPVAVKEYVRQYKLENI